MRKLWLTITLLGLPVVASAANWQSLATIEQAAIDFTRDLLSQGDAAVIQAGPMDTRLKLPACASPLAADSGSPLRSGGGTVQISCDGPTRWKLFVPVRTSIRVPVVVARHTIARGSPLAADDLSVEFRSSRALPLNYIGDIAHTTGHTAHRTLTPGTVLTTSALDRTQMIERGALVTLTSERSGIMVKSEGVALDDAVAGQRVRIRTRTGRIVEGRAEDQGRVRVGRGDRR
jgi:flagella basal body P-ring formation protein FlgA